MATLKNVNPRGIRVSPAYQQDTYHYYLCLLDVSATAGVDPSKFKLEAIAQDDTVIKFKYEGTLSDPTADDSLVTLMLPVVLSQKLAKPNAKGDNLSFTVTDKDGNSSGGNPNKGRPPVVPAVDRTQGLISSALIFQSETVTTCYFVGVIVNTAYAIGGETGDGGYSNALQLGTSDTVIEGSLQAKADKNPVAAYGVIPSSPNAYDTIRISAGTVVSSDLNFDYGTVHTF